MEIKTSVAVVVEKDGKILLVKENREGKIVYNQPAGYLEPEETISDGAVREAKEETGFEVELGSLVGIYEIFFPKTQIHTIRFCFVAHIVGGKLSISEKEEVIEAVFLSQEAIQSMPPEQFRNAAVSLCVSDYLKGSKYPLKLLQHFKSW